MTHIRFHRLDSAELGNGESCMLHLKPDVMSRVRAVRWLGGQTSTIVESIRLGGFEQMAVGSVAAGALETGPLYFPTATPNEPLELALRHVGNWQSAISVVLELECPGDGPSWQRSLIGHAERVRAGEQRIKIFRPETYRGYRVIGAQLAGDAALQWNAETADAFECTVRADRPTEITVLVWVAKELK